MSDIYVFPHHSNDGNEHQGMTLRDHFAGQVFPQVYMMCSESDEGGRVLAVDAEWVADESYRIADYMINRRNER